MVSNTDVEFVFVTLFTDSDIQELNSDDRINGLMDQVLMEADVGPSPWKPIRTEARSRWNQVTHLWVRNTSRDLNS